MAGRFSLGYADDSFTTIASIGIQQSDRLLHAADKSRTVILSASPRTRQCACGAIVYFSVLSSFSPARLTAAATRPIINSENLISCSSNDAYNLQGPTLYPTIPASEQAMLIVPKVIACACSRHAMKTSLYARRRDPSRRRPLSHP